jgi:hypothetical protein
MTAQIVLSTGVGRYFSWGVINISITNLLIIIVMIAVFVLALVIPFGGHGSDRDEHRDGRS